jgi:pyruvate dehydrogenase E2 component (dihydrolipoamide acetyltransferase)
VSGIRRAIAAAMTKSNREIPHYYLQTRIDMHAALSYLEQHNAQRPIQQRVLPAAMLVKAVATALTKTPHLNGFWIDDRPQFQEGIHIGTAISLRQGGLVIPAIHDADAKTVDEIMDAMRDVIPRARAGRLKSSEISDTTITVTNLGDLGVETVYGVVYPPQIALVGFGKIVEQPWARDGMIGIRPVLSATLAADHRATDGHEGAQFLSELDAALQHPEAL